MNKSKNQPAPTCPSQSAFTHDQASAQAVQARKGEHLVLGRSDVESRRPAGWGDITLVHQALPEIDFESIDLSVEFLGKRLDAPLVIAAMTGGHEDAFEINAILARAAQRYGLAMGLGSQRAALKNPELAYTYEVARAEAPNGFLIANIGVAQLIRQSEGQPAMSRDGIQRAIDMLRADALAVHLNFLEEVVQPEGDRRAAGCREALSALIASLGAEIPVVVKETGAGISTTVADWIAKAGAAAIDVGGRGGTSFAALEARRAMSQEDAARARVGELFRDWGIPTPASVAAAATTHLPIIATGGVRNGLDMAKAIALGATLVGVARPMLQAVHEGEAELSDSIEQFLLELRTAMFLTGSPNLAALRKAAYVVSGETKDWLR